MGDLDKVLFLMDIKELQQRTQREGHRMAYQAARAQADSGASRRAMLYLASQLARFGGGAAAGLLGVIGVVLAGLLIAAFAIYAILYQGEVRAPAISLGSGIMIVSRIVLWLFMVGYGVFSATVRARGFVQGRYDAGRFLNWRAAYTAQICLTSVAFGCGAFLLTPSMMAARDALVVQGGLGLVAFGFALGQCYHRAGVLAASVPAGILCLAAALQDKAQLWGSTTLFAVGVLGMLVLGWRALFKYACHLSILAVIRYPAVSQQSEASEQQGGYNPYKLKRG